MKPEREMALVTYVQGLKKGLCLYSILHREQQSKTKKKEEG
jgi:hypothetical protein